MGNGMLSQWRRGMVARGLATAALLAVPVTVAAAIGFEGSLGGLYDGLDAVVSGPETAQTEPASAASDVEPAAATAPATVGAATARANRRNAAGNDTADAPVSGGGGGGAPIGGSGGGSGGADLGLPTGGGGSGGGGGILGGGGSGGGGILGGGGSSGGGGSVGGAVNDVVNGVNETVGGVLGGRN